MLFESLWQFYFFWGGVLVKLFLLLSKATYKYFNECFCFLIFQIMKENQDTGKPMSEIYGAVHLLRLFGKNSDYVFHL